jgi:hypothetical protein
MKVEDIKEVLFLEPWQLTGPGLESELAQEVSEQHPLFGKRAVAVARRHDNDDVLFFLPDRPQPLAVVHLTWRREQSPEWPWTVFFSSLQDWVERCMKRDHDEINQRS